MSATFTASGDIFIRNPATGSLSGSVTAAVPATVVEAAATARTKASVWGSAPVEERVAVINRFHDLILKKSELVLDTIQSETGKTRRDAMSELITVAGTARYYGVHGPAILKAESRRGAVPLLTHASVFHRPHGVVGVITPWNFPFLLPAGETIPALIAGNAVLVKPSERTPLSSELLEDLWSEAGLVFGLLRNLHGGASIAEAVIEVVDYVSFTGGSDTGRRVAQLAAGRLIPFSLELGGKNPMIVLDGAPVDDAVQGALVGAFSNAGQTCVSVERLFVTDGIWNDFVPCLTAAVRALKVGFSAGWDVDIGPMIDSEHADRVLRRIEDAAAAGAVIAAGGRRRSDIGDAFIEPTVLLNPDMSLDVYRRETFGPVITVHRVRDAFEAVQYANASEYGLNASVWGPPGEAERVARSLRTGSVGLNSTLMIYNTFDAPLGGVGWSGIGRRHGPEGLLRFTQPQSVVRSWSRGGGYDRLLSALTSSARAKLYIDLARWWRRIPGIR